MSSCNFISYFTIFEIVNYFMFHIFSSTIKLHGFEIFTSLSFDICLIVFNVPENVFLFYEMNLSTLFCTISEANIIVFSSNSSCLSWPPDISKCYITILLYSVLDCCGNDVI